MADTDPVELDDEALRRLVKPKFPILPILVVVGAIAGLIALVELYEYIPQKGLTVEGEAHIAVTPAGDAWALFTTGVVVQVEPKSAAKFHLQPGPCKRLSGAMADPLPLYEVEEAECQPGEKLLPSLISRLRWMGLRYGYWPDGIQADGSDLNRSLTQTPEVVAALIDPRADDPQLIPLYMPLAPLSIKAARARGLPPPVIVSVKRNDLMVNRLRRAALEEFLDRTSFVFAGANPAGGWLVRELLVAPEGTPTLERLLVAPEEAPWPERLRDHTVRVARRVRASERSAETTQNSAGRP